MITTLARTGLGGQTMTKMTPAQCYDEQVGHSSPKTIPEMTQDT